MKKASSPDRARRRLLASGRNAAAAAAAVAVLGPVLPANAPARAATSPTQEPQDRGYRESEHTRRYYELARF